METSFNTIRDEKNQEHHIPQVWYHGTNSIFKEFNLSYLDKNWNQSILGIYLTQYKTPPPYGSTAIEYADYVVITKGGHPYVAECTVNIKKPLILDSDGWYSSNVCIDRQRSDIRRWMGTVDYDSVLAYHHEDSSKEGIGCGDYILVVKNPSDITIRKWIDGKKIRNENK